MLLRLGPSEYDAFEDVLGKASGLDSSVVMVGEAEIERLRNKFAAAEVVGAHRFVAVGRADLSDLSMIFMAAACAWNLALKDREGVIAVQRQLHELGRDDPH